MGIAFTARAFAQTDTRTAMELFHRRQWNEAAAAFAAVETRAPGTTEALLYQGKALVNLGEFPVAGDALQRFLIAHPKSDDALDLLAYVLFRENQPKESLQKFTEAAQIKPPAADDLKIIALDYVLLNDYTSAGRRLEEALALDPANMEALYHLGRVRYQQNKFDLAIAAFREVLLHDPKNVKAEDNLGLSLEGKNQVDDAVLAYRQAIKLDRASLVRTEQPYLNLAILLAKLSRTEEAVALLEESAQIAPRSPQVHRELAKNYLAMQRLEEAKREAERAVELDPNDSSAHYLLGRIYHRLGKTDLAAQHFATTEELIRQERAKPGGMGTSGTERR